jgi:hypothetical protein
MEAIGGKRLQKFVSTSYRENGEKQLRRTRKFGNGKWEGHDPWVEDKRSEYNIILPAAGFDLQHGLEGVGLDALEQSLEMLRWY